MKTKSMTALISAYARAHHFKNNSYRIFSDNMAAELLSSDEYSQISESMKSGIGFFNSSFSGSDEQALKWIVDNYLSPTPLGRAAYCEDKLETAVSKGAHQYVIWAAGYDSFAYRQPSFAENISIFEIDHPITSKDKQTRVANLDIEAPSNTYYIESDFPTSNLAELLRSDSNYDPSKISFHSLLGLSYYLTREVFTDVLNDISEVSAGGSSIVFDYPDEFTFTDKAAERTQKQLMLATQADEKMKASYSKSEIEEVLGSVGFKVYENLSPDEITEKYFNEYNSRNQDSIITAFDNVNYCYAVKK